MIKAAKKAQSLVELLRQEPRRRKVPNWLELLPPDTLADIEAVKEAIQNGELQVSKKRAAEKITEKYGEDHLGVKTDAIRIWLGQ